MRRLGRGSKVVVGVVSAATHAKRIGVTTDQLAATFDARVFQRRQSSMKNLKALLAAAGLSGSEHGGLSPLEAAQAVTLRGCAGAAHRDAVCHVCRCRSWSCTNQESDNGPCQRCSHTRTHHRTGALPPLPTDTCRRIQAAMDVLEQRDAPRQVAALYDLQFSEQQQQQQGDGTLSTAQWIRQYAKPSVAVLSAPADGTSQGHSGPMASSNSHYTLAPLAALEALQQASPEQVVAASVAQLLQTGAPLFPLNTSKPVAPSGVAEALRAVASRDIAAAIQLVLSNNAPLIPYDVYHTIVEAASSAGK